MVYLEKIELLDDYTELVWISANQDARRLDNSMYPLHIFPKMNLETIDFEPITIFCGGNGCGKSTLLNIIASKLNADRLNSIDKGFYFNEYVKLCKVQMSFEEPVEIKAIMSDDVFDYLLDIRAINAKVNRKKEALGSEYLNNKYEINDYSINDYEKLKAKSDSISKTRREYTRERLTNVTINEHSNGESALLFWEREIKDNSIYILDEPENSLSAANQLKLKTFIEQSARFYNCQFIISTHSPFLLSLLNAKIYDLDSDTHIKNWTDVENVRLYYDFFKENRSAFEND